MNFKELKKLNTFEENYWWHVGRRLIINRLLTNVLKGVKNEILDVGCGTGANLVLLKKFGKIRGLDKSESALDFCRQKGFLLWQLKKGSAESLPFPTRSFNLVTLFDVLEHIQDEKGALEETFRVLKPQGLVLLTVPAYQFLWSEHDVSLGHYRRYTKERLRQILRGAGFSTIKISYVISTLFPAIFLFRMLQKVWTKESHTPKSSYIILPSALNKLGIELLKLEAALLPHLSFPFGVSLVALAKKRGDKD